MVKVTARENEDIDSLMRRFKTAINKNGVLLECKNREFYLKPALKRKRKSEQARIKNRKK